MTNPYRELLQSQVKDTNTRLRAAQATEAAQSAATTQLTPAIATFDKNIDPAALTVAGILLSWETPPTTSPQQLRRPDSHARGFSRPPPPPTSDVRYRTDKCSRFALPAVPSARI
ncbi:hypothetical protein [Streptomyces sp. MBT62]|uniref:hypothetical protein n=1 Tax=Streptomyces sp. MBT62 TaxID=2800410 RepID=UPI00190DFEB3|nr:hypothetical protein [Streptomyces sp. MBT62]MBK3564182.1 hypothetical protein [Streptomyces sp. MBT62]